MEVEVMGAKCSDLSQCGGGSSVMMAACDAHEHL